MRLYLGLEGSCRQENGIHDTWAAVSGKLPECARGHLMDVELLIKQRGSCLGTHGTLGTNVSETELGADTVDRHGVDVQVAGATCRGRKGRDRELKVKPGMLSSGWNIWLRG